MDVGHSVGLLLIIVTVSTCVQSATVKPATCGGKPRPTSNPCVSCTCQSNKWKCSVYDCMTVQCVDAVVKKGECCPSCPNGPNCDIEGTVVSWGQIINFQDGRQCQCVEHSNQYPPPSTCVEPPVVPQDYFDDAGESDK